MEPTSQELGSFNENTALLGAGVVVSAAAVVVDDVNDIDDISIPIFAQLISRSIECCNVIKQAAIGTESAKLLYTLLRIL